MSQFDLPRINFHGTALLDVATANNGNYEPALTLFDQDESEAFLPPRCYLPNDPKYKLPPGFVVEPNDGKPYVAIDSITVDNYQQWATTALGKFAADEFYWPLYDSLTLTGNNPGYWNYYGDLSLSLINTQVTGITFPKTGGGVVTYTEQNQVGCPPSFAEMFGALLSFNNNYFAPGSRTSAYMCDADSIGQMCTQIFCSQVGLYKTDDQQQQTTFFSGTPVKSTSRWMNLNKVLNYSDMSIIPMGGSACFYSMITLNNGSDLLNMYQQYSGKMPTGLFMKLMIHEVYEVRDPDYSKLPKDQTGLSKNPATVSVSGSITPYYEGDMKTVSISRLLKNDSALTIDVLAIPPPYTNPPITNKPLSVANHICLAPIQFIHNPTLNLLSLDIINFINEYGTEPATIASYAGDNDIPPFTKFESYNFGTFELWFQPDNKSTPLNIGSFDFDTDYQMQQLLANGGVIDFAVSAGADFSVGYFYMVLNGTTVFTEDNYFITSDQMGNYAQQSQPSNNYMSDGLPRIPCTLRVFYRGVPASQKLLGLTATRQAIDMRSGTITNTSGFHVYDGIQMNFPVDVDGCMTYAFVDSESITLPNMSPGVLFPFIMNNSLIVLRTLSSQSPLHLEPYLTGQTPITWDVVYNNVFSLFKVLYPVMDVILPFTQANWSDPFILNKMMMMMSDSNWNKPMYMPITRDLSAPQQQLLQMWANQIINPPAGN